MPIFEVKAWYFWMEVCYHQSSSDWRIGKSAASFIIPLQQWWEYLERGNESLWFPLSVINTGFHTGLSSVGGLSTCLLVFLFILWLGGSCSSSTAFPPTCIGICLLRIYWHSGLFCTFHQLNCSDLILVAGTSHWRSFKNVLSELQRCEKKNCIMEIRNKPGNPSGWMSPSWNKLDIRIRFQDEMFENVPSLRYIYNENLELHRTVLSCCLARYTRKEKCIHSSICP